MVEKMLAQRKMSIDCTHTPESRMLLWGRERNSPPEHSVCNTEYVSPFLQSRLPDSKALWPKLGKFKPNNEKEVSK